MWIAHPAFVPMARWLGDDVLPSPGQLNAWVDALVAEGGDARPQTTRGAAVRFVEADATRQRALDYETKILVTGRVPLRPGDWHDAFNALAWIAWPAFKREVNALHVASAEPGAPSRRGALRDALTLLDESGVIVLSADAELATLLRGREWRALFCDRRARVARAMRFLVCGHALCDKLRAPYPSLTGRALIVAVPAGVMDRDVDAQRRHADGMAADSLSTLGSTAATVPLPVSTGGRT